jgi:hypothetical protein
MRAVVKEQLASSPRIELERMQGNRSRLVHDDGVGVGKIRHLPGHAIGDDRARLPVGIVDHLRARSFRPFAELAHVYRACGCFLSQRRCKQLLDRRGEVVEPVADIADKRHLGEHHIAHAGGVNTACR